MTQPSGSLARRFLIASALIALSLAAAFGILEVGLRLFYPMSDFLWQWDERIGMKLIPGKQGRSVRPGSFDVAVSVNADGFRDRDHAVAKPAGGFRIVLLGDSFVEAIQVRFEDSVGAVLQQRLERSRGRVETMNFGVSGSGTARQYLALREYALRYRPDLVLLFFVGNDVSDNSPRLKGAPYFPYPRLSGAGNLLRDSAGEPLFTTFAAPEARLALPDAVKHHWKTYRFLRQLADRSAPVARSGLGYYELYRRDPRPAWAEAWSTTEQLILATRDLAQAHNAGFGVVLVPAAWEVYPEQWKQIISRVPGASDAAIDPDYPSRRLKQFLHANGVRVFDLLDDFRRQAAGLAPLYIPEDAHWTAAGHRLAAELLAEALAHGANPPALSESRPAP